MFDSKPFNDEILISSVSLNLSELNASIQNSEGENGASVIFTGSVRVSEKEKGLTGMMLEHYPGMTEKQLQLIVDEAKQRWQLTKVKVVHRIGFLTAGEPIVFVGVCSLHRKASFEAAQFIMDYLKQKATFWKKEHYGDKTIWVESKASDKVAAQRW